MDYRKIIKDEQDKFLENPRQSIEKSVKQLDEWAKWLSNLSDIQNRPLMLILFYDFHKEYSSIIGELYKKRIVTPSNFKNDEEMISLMMRIREIESGVRDYQQKAKPIDVSALVLSRLYATSLEMFFNKIRDLVFLAKLNSNKEYLSLGNLIKKVEELEKIHNVKLTKIKSFLNSSLRNSVNHENTRFENPNVIVFLDTTGKELGRLNTEEICEKLVELMAINMALRNVELTVMVSYLELLLKLDDNQLNEYCKTGILTKEMEDRISKPN